MGRSCRPSYTPAGETSGGQTSLRPSDWPKVEIPTTAPAQTTPTLPVSEKDAPALERTSFRQEIAEPVELPAALQGQRFQQPAVSIEWIGPEKLRLKSPAEYQLQVKNVTTQEVQNVVVLFRIPDGVRVEAVTPEASSSDGLLSWPVGALAAGQQLALKLTVIPEKAVAVPFEARVTFTGTAQLPVLVYEPKLNLQIAPQAGAVMGGPAVMQFTVSNPGDGPTDPVRVAVRPPSGLEHLRGAAIDMDMGILNAREQRSFRVGVLARSPGARTRWKPRRWREPTCGRRPGARCGSESRAAAPGVGGCGAAPSATWTVRRCSTSS